MPSGPDSISAGAFGFGGAILGDTASQVAASPGHSYNIHGAVINSQVYAETDYFSTIGLPYVRLEFDHIAKIYLLNNAIIEISVDSGATWVQLTAAQYVGTDPLFKGTNYFNHVSHTNLLPGGIWKATIPLAIPDNSWWVAESFDLTGLASDTTIQGSFIGYPAVKLRFRANFNNYIISTSQFAAGWFIDNINVTGAICELDPPEISYEFQSTQPIPCYINQPRGEIPSLSSNSYSIGVIATDTIGPSSGLDSVVCFFRVNGGTWTSQNMLKQFSPPREYKCDLTNIQNGDQVDYYVTAWDLCGNSTQNPASGAFFSFSPTTYPTKCNTTLCDTLSVISQFPWYEDFEGTEWAAGFGTGDAGTTHRGNFPITPNGAWGLTPAVVQQEGWSIRTGPTGTIATGPNSDHTSGTGKYIYAEFSPINPAGSSSTSLITPCIDLRDTITKVFSFYYHSYGAEMKNLRIDIDTGTSAVSYWNAYSRVKGPQQYSSIDPWKKAWVSLEPFKGKVIKIRLTSIVIGNVDKTDLAIDDLSIEEPSLTDVELVGILSPVGDPCGPSSSVPLRIAIRNLGPDSLYSIPVAYQFNGNAIVRDTIVSAGLALADSMYYVFQDSLTFSSSTANAIKVWTELSNDTDYSNDSLDINLRARIGITNQFPYYLDFESALVNPGTPGNINDPVWLMNETSLGGQFEIFEGVLDNTTLGPIEALGKSKRAIRLRSFPGATSTKVNLQSSCFDLSAMTFPSISFSHYLANGKTLIVRVKTSTQDWTPIATISGFAGFKDLMTMERISLGGFQGESVQIEFLIDDLSSGDYTNQVILDNILIAEQTQRDIGLNGVIGKLRRVPANSTSLIPFDVNIDKSMWNSAPSTQLQLQLTSLCNANAPVLTGSISFAPVINGTSVLQSLPAITLSDTLRPDRYELKAWLKTSGDSLHFNDTLYQFCLAQETATVPYFNDFEACNDQFNTNGPMRQWQKSNPIGGAYSGVGAYVTNADTALVSGLTSVDVLIPPFFFGLDTVVGAELRFFHRYDFNGPVDDNYGTVQYFANGFWNPLINQSAPPNPAFNMVYSNIHGYVFHGSTAGQWTYASFGLDLAKRPGGNVLRFITRSGDTSISNWEIDDFEIYVPPQVSASPTDLAFNNTIPKKQNTVALRLRNSGAKGLYQAFVNIYDQSGVLLLRDSLNLTSGIFAGQSKLINLRGNLNLNPGVNELMIVTQRPNNRIDAFPKDDTLRVSIKVLEDISSLPYCVDFESDPELLAFTKGTPDKLWKHTTPAKGILNGANSGTFAWITGFTGDYPAGSNNYLYAPSAKLKGQSCYRLSFNHWFQTEFNLDGGNIEFTLDSGLTWQTLGQYGDSTWYNTPYVQSLDAIEPGFSGSNGGWSPAFLDFKLFADEKIQFRFRFASNATVEDEGWMIDDLCLEAIPGWCYQVGSEELNLRHSPASLYPNPASNKLYLEVTSLVELNPDLSIQIINSVGQLVKEMMLEPTGKGLYAIDISSLPKGGYLLRSEINGEPWQKTFVKR